MEDQRLLCRFSCYPFWRSCKQLWLPTCVRGKRSIKVRLGQTDKRKTEKEKKEPGQKIPMVISSQLSLVLSSKGVFTRENSHRREFHTGMTFWFRIAFTWWLGHFISCYLTVHFMLIKYTFGSKSQTLRMRYPFQSTGRPISHRNGWSFRVYMIPLRDFVLWWYH